MRKAISVLLVSLIFAPQSFASLELQEAHLISDGGWVTEEFDGEAVCYAGLLKLMVGDRGVGFSGMSLPMLETAQLVIDHKQTFLVSPELVYQTSATYLLSNREDIKSAVLSATTVQFMTRNCGDKGAGIFTAHGCPRTITWKLKQPLGKCTSGLN